MEPRYELDLCQHCGVQVQVQVQVHLQVDDCRFGSPNDWVIILKHAGSPLLLYNLYEGSPYYSTLAFVDGDNIWKNDEFDCRAVLDDYDDLHQRCKAGTTVKQLWNKICKERQLYMD
jgi:hypothetical protein